MMTDRRKFRLQMALFATAVAGLLLMALIARWMGR